MSEEVELERVRSKKIAVHLFDEYDGCRETEMDLDDEVIKMAESDPRRRRQTS